MKSISLFYIDNGLYHTSAIQKQETINRLTAYKNANVDRALLLLQKEAFLAQKDPSTRESVLESDDLFTSNSESPPSTVNTLCTGDF